MKLSVSQTAILERPAGPRLRYFLDTVFLVSFLISISQSIAQAQLVCVRNPEECKAEFCTNLRTPANLFIEHPVKLRGIVVDPTEATFDFDSIRPGFQTIVLIKSLETNETLYAVPLRKNGEFEFELVPAGNYRFILVWMNKGKFYRLPLADQPDEIHCTESNECNIRVRIKFHGTDNPVDACPPK